MAVQHCICEMVCKLCEQTMGIGQCLYNAFRMSAIVTCLYEHLNNGRSLLVKHCRTYTTLITHKK